MLKQKSILRLLVVFIILLFSCKSKEHQEVVVHFQRYDKAIFTKNSSQLLAEYPDFTPFYLQHIIKVGHDLDTTTITYFNEFKATYQNDAYDSVQLVFPDMKQTEKALGKALGNYKYFFPNDTLPEFYTHFSGFNEAIISKGNIISISLENYLGDCPFYDALGIYKYLREGMYPSKIPVDIVKILLLQKAAPEHATDNLLSAIIYQGKIYYALHQIFPEKDLSFLLNYTEIQQKWCEANEPTMWSFLIENKHLFSSDYRTIRHYIDPAPFTKGFPEESPGQTGIWVGYQIVENYMKNTETSLAELLQRTDYKTILQQAAYNPE